MAEQTEIWRKCLRLMLWPVVRFWIRRGQDFQEFGAVAKHVFLEVAISELESVGEKVNPNRLRVMTGLQRKLITEMHYEGRSPFKEKGNLLPQIIGAWEQDKRFTTKEGRPRTLSCKGADSEFALLVSSVDQWIHAGTVLHQLQLMGAVEKTKTKVKMLKENPINQRFSKDPESGFALIARGINALMQAGEENVFSESDHANLHSHTEADNIYAEDLPHLKEWILREGRAFHRKVREYIAQFDADLNYVAGKQAGAKVTYGSFSVTTTPSEQAKASEIEKV